MSPFQPTGPYGHGLTGCGTRVHLDSTINAADPIGDYRTTRPLIPGYEVPLPRPDGARVWLLNDGETFVELPDGSFEATAPDLEVPVAIDVDEVYRAGEGIANLVQARLHDARKRQQIRAELAIFDDPIDEVLAGMVARALAGAA